MTFTTGTRVAYSVQYLHAIHEAPTGRLCHLRGVVESVKPLGSSNLLVTVLWDCGETSRVHGTNLAVVGLNHRFSNCGIGFPEAAR